MPTATRYLGRFQISDSTWTENAKRSSSAAQGKTAPQAWKPMAMVTTPVVAGRKRRQYRNAAPKLVAQSHTKMPWSGRLNATTSAIAVPTAAHQSMRPITKEVCLL